MQSLRRLALARVGSAAAMCLAAASGLLRPLSALARPWQRKAFGAQTLDDALQELGLTKAVDSQDIIIRAPEIAENGAQVPIEISSRIDGVEVFYIFVDKNPQPFCGSFSFLNGAQPFVVTRIKMAETSLLRVFARAGDRSYAASREVKVTIGGCGE